VLAAGLALASSRAPAIDIGPDAFGYRASDAVAPAFEDIAGTGVLTLARTDDGVFTAPLGFTFNFYGRDFNTVAWSANALVSFGGTNSQFGNVNFATARPAVDLPSIAVLWDDWTFNHPQGGGAYYETRGIPGARRFIIQWTRAVDVDTIIEIVTFQVVLHEGSNDIVMQYLEVDSGDPLSRGGQATVGIRDTGGHLNGMNLVWSHNAPVISNGQAIRFSTSFDDVPPAVEVTSPADGAVLAATEVEVAVSIADESATTVSSSPAGLSASLPAGGGSFAGIVPLVEGPNVIAVSATDASGNAGGASITVTRDTIGPRILRLFPASGGVFGESPVPFSMDVEDATPATVTFAGHVLSLPAGGGTAAADVPLIEGLNTVAIVVVDAAGNQETHMVDVFLDSTTPLVRIDSPADGACLGQGRSPVPLVVTVDDASATTVTSEPEGVSGSLPPGGGIVAGAVQLVEGPNAITVTVSDAVGRASSASIVVVLDTMPPAVALVSPPDGEAVRYMVDVAASVADDGCGVALVDLRVDGRVLASMSAGPFEAILDTMSLEDGVHVLSAAAVDIAGNAASAAVEVIVDNTAPEIAMTAPDAGAEVSGLVGFAAQASDAAGAGLVHLDVLVNGTAPSTLGAMDFDPPSREGLLSGTEDTTRWPDGPLSFTAMAVDAAGNEARASITVMVRNAAPPEVTISPATGSIVSGMVPVVVEVAGAPVERIEVFADGILAGSGRTSPLSIGLDTTTRLDGVLTIAAHVLHRGGATSSASVQVTVDNLSVVLVPSVLRLGKDRARDCGFVVARVAGPSAGLLLPVKKHAIELRVPGGSPVPVKAWWGSDRSRGKRRCEPKVFLLFDRQRLVSSVKAGMAAGMIEEGAMVELTLVARGSVIGTAYVRVHAGRKG
jgi:hypothetical protein